MIVPEQPDPGDTFPQDLTWLALLGQFVLAWQQVRPGDVPPCLDRYVELAPPVNRDVLRERLVAVDELFREQAGELDSPSALPGGTYQGGESPAAYSTVSDQPDGLARFRWIPADQRQRWLRGERTLLEEYLRDLSPGEVPPRALLELISAEIALREEMGDRVTVEEYARRFPGQSATLERQIALLRLLSNPQGPGTSSTQQGSGAKGEPTPVPVIPGYEILSELGRGGMGIVYKARQQTLKRIVALKMVLAGQHANAEMRARFLIEAETVARLQHPAVVQVHEFGIVDGQPFFSMEYCEGGSLALVLARGALSPRMAARLLVVLADVLQAAHTQGIIHRDLKPANILLSVKEGAQGSDPNHEDSSLSLVPGTSYLPKVTDFGLARWTDSQLTLSEAVLGTPSYMAPEQTHDARSADARADVYALGAILYECLTGKPPFRADTVFDTLLLVRQNDPVPPRQLNDAVPRDLETICLKCLQKNPARRYPTAHALGGDLARFLEGRPVEARPISLAEHLWRWTSRHRALTALGLVSGIAALALVALGLWYSASLTKVQAAEAEAKAAGQAAQTATFFHLFNRVRERSARPRPGWSGDNLQDLDQLARLPAAREHLPELRSEVAACLGSVDVRRSVVLGKGAYTCNSLAWHPGGRQVAVSVRLTGFIPAVHLYDLNNPEQPKVLAVPPAIVWKKPLEPLPEIVFALAFSPDGRWLVAGGRSGRLIRWDLREATPRARAWQGPSTSVEFLAFSPDGSSLYSADVKLLQRWDVATWKEAARFPAPARLSGLAVHPTEGWLACRTNQLHRLHALTLQEIRPATDAAGDAVCFLPQGAAYACVRSRQIWLGETASDFVLQRLRAPDQEEADEGSVDVLSVHPDGSLLLSATAQTHHVKLWDRASGRLLVDLPIGTGCSEVAFSPDGSAFAVLADKQVELFHISGLREQRVTALQVSPVQAAALSADGQRLTTLSGEAGLDDLTSWSLNGPLGPRPVQRWRVALPGSRLVSCADVAGWLATAVDGHPHLRLHDSLTGVSREVPDKLSQAFLKAGPDGRLWGAVGDEVRSWDLPQGTATVRYKNRLGRQLTGSPEMVSLAVGKRRVVAGGRDGSLRILVNSPGAYPPALIRVAATPLDSVALLEDEEFAVVGTHPGTLSLVQLAEPQLVQSLPAHDDRIACLATSSGNLLASGSRDGTVKLWQYQDSQLIELLTLRHPRPVRWLALQGDGKRLAVLLDREFGVRLWDLDRLRNRLQELELGEGLEVIGAGTLPPPPSRKAAIPAEPADGLQGLRLEVVADGAPDRIVQVQRVSNVDVSWPAPPAPFTAQHALTLRWTGWLKAPKPGRYKVGLEGAERCQLWLGGQKAIDLPRGVGKKRHTAEVNLGAEPLPLRVEYTHYDQPVAVRLFWSTGSTNREQTVPAKALFLSRPKATP